MGDMKKESIGPLLRSALETGLTVTGHPLTARVTGPLLTRFMRMTADWFNERNQRKFDGWLHEIAASNEFASAEETMTLIEAHIDEPWAHGPLEDAVRAIRDGIDESALAYLAKLAAWQLRDKMPPDRWSRRAVGLLLDSDSSMIDALKAFAAGLRDNCSPVVALDAVSGSQTCSVDYPGKGDDGASYSTPTHPLFAELFVLLRSHQFGSEGGESPWRGEQTITIREEEKRFLLRLFA